MEEIGVRELRNQVAAVLRRAAAGERIVITADGIPLAQLGPLEADHKGVTLLDLAAAGLLEPPVRRDRPMPPEPKDAPVDVRLDRVLDELRGR